jgi:putative PIN family toxin of toxin-antitoxin system
MKSSGVWRVLLDCSTFLSAIFYPLGKPNKILFLWIEGLYDLYLTKDIYLEYQRKIKDMAVRLKKSEEKGQSWLIFLNQRAIFVNPLPLPKTSCRDFNDVKYLEVAAGSRADFLISSDKDLLILKKFKKTKIVTPDEFLKTI